MNTQQFIDTLHSSLSPIYSLSCPNLAAKHCSETLKSTLDKAAPLHSKPPNTIIDNLGTHLKLKFFVSAVGVLNILKENQTYYQIFSITNSW